jgi:hypothetical protein
MSYHATISFKTVKPGEIYSFLQKFKEETVKNLDAVAEDEFIYMPSVRNEHLYEGVRKIVKRDADENWAKKVFTHRFFYLAEHDLFAVFGVPDAAQNVYDATIYFQNSCDQDYKFDTWKGVPIFEKIAEKWKNATDQEVENRYYSKNDGSWDEDEPLDHNYYRRSYAYDEIWDMCEEYLYNDEAVVYLSLFGFYDFQPISQFVQKCTAAYEAWRSK